MSWLFAVSKAENGGRTVDSYCHSTALATISTPSFYLSVGGNPDTCFWQSNSGGSAGWAVVGIGILGTNAHPTVLKQDEWGRLLAQESFDVTALDGHFVVLRWDADRVECFTDQLGLRSLHFGKYGEGICVSTRLDWVARTTNHAELDFASLGSRWLLFNQLGYESGIAGIERLGPGGHAAFRSGSSVHCTAFTPWLPSFEPNSPVAAMDLVKGLVECALAHDYEPSLGLSGGLDSRLLLAFLTSSPHPGFGTHTFGDRDDPDVYIARRITSSLGIPHHHFDDPLPDAHACLSGIRTFVAHTALIEPITTFLRLRYYPKLRDVNRLMIDGGFGEIARRQYLNRVVRLGRSALRQRDAPRLLRLMRAHRADIFSQEVTAQLETGACRSLEKTLDQLPAIEKIGVENFADLLAVRTRVPNFGAPEQARLDGEILNFMPLVQPSFLRLVFGTPPKLRSNAGLYYGMIRSMNPALSRFPLVKSGYTYRFGSSSTVSWGTVKLKSRFARGYSDSKPALLLSRLREYVLDVAHSKDVTADPIYDSRKVLGAVTRYYEGDDSLRSTVDWWLTFELWKRCLSSHQSGFSFPAPTNVRDTTK